jgi:hypothetical protein
LHTAALKLYIFEVVVCGLGPTFQISHFYSK